MKLNENVFVMSIFGIVIFLRVFVLLFRAALLKSFRNRFEVLAMPYTRIREWKARYMHEAGPIETYGYIVSRACDWGKIFESIAT